MLEAHPRDGRPFEAVPVLAQDQFELYRCTPSAACAVSKGAAQAATPNKVYANGFAEEDGTWKAVSVGPTVIY
jgi:hypothetical protein